MAARLRATLAVLALVGVGAAAGAALVVIGERAAAPGEARDGTAEALALLRDDVRTLRTDVDALATALGENFERLARAVEDGAARRQQELRQDLAALERPHRDSAAAPPASSAATPVAPAAVAAPPVADGPANAAPASDPPPTASAPKAAPAGQAFLSFKLPNRALQFDRE